MAGVLGLHTAGAESTVGQLTPFPRAPRYSHSEEWAQYDTALKRSAVSGPRLWRGKEGKDRWKSASLTVCQSSLRGARVRLEPLRPAQPDGVLNERPRRPAVDDAQPGPHPQERVHREASAEAGSAAGGQHVVRACPVVAQHLRAPRAYEQRAVVGETRRDRVGVPQLELEVLGGNGVARRDAVRHARHDDGA